MATHSSILAWGIPWTEEPGGLQSMGSQHVGHDGAHPQKARGSPPWAAWRRGPGVRVHVPAGPSHGHLCPVITTSLSLSPTWVTTPHTPEEGLHVTDALWDAGEACQTPFGCLLKLKEMQISSDSWLPTLGGCGRSCLGSFPPGKHRAKINLFVKKCARLLVLIFFYSILFLFYFYLWHFISTGSI